MADDTAAFQLEYSGSWPQADTEICWADLPRKPLVGHPKVFAGFQVALADGRTINLMRMDQSFIYGYDLSPTIYRPERILDDARMRAKQLAPWVASSPVVLPPTLFSSNHSMPSLQDEASLGSSGTALTLPRVQVIGEFLSSASEGSSESFSTLLVIWYQDNFGDIPAEIQTQLAKIDWDYRSSDWTP